MLSLAMVVGVVIKTCTVYIKQGADTMAIDPNKLAKDSDFRSITRKHLESHLCFPSEYKGYSYKDTIWPAVEALTREFGLPVECDFDDMVDTVLEGLQAEQ